MSSSANMHFFHKHLQVAVFHSSDNDMIKDDDIENKFICVFTDPIFQSIVIIPSFYIYIDLFL